MDAFQREAGLVVLRDHPDGPPRVLLVAVAAVRAQLAVVVILVAADAALCVEDGDGAAVVVAAQAPGARVRPVEGHAGLALVIELKIFDQGLPPLPDVAQRAIRRERVVGEDRAEPGPPTVPRDLRPLVHDTGHDEERQRGDEREGAFA